MRVVGLDIGRAKAVAALLESFPTNPQRYFSQHRRNFLTLEANKEGAEKLLLLAPDVVVLEPTGNWYSTFWRHLASANNIKVLWVGHGDLAYQRGHYGFKNKRDDEDAFCLGLTYFDNRFIDRSDRPRFLSFDFGAIEQVRRRFYELEQLQKHRTALVQNLRQRLCEEFPEIAQRSTKISSKLGYAPLWGWLAGIRSYTRIENEYSRSIANEIGINISLYTRDHAHSICTIEQRITQTECELVQLMQEPEFEPYLRAFKRFGFGITNQAQLLCKCYPFDKFLVAGRPWIEWEETASGKRQKRHRSQRSFQAYLGLSYKLKQSGDKLSKSFQGSDLTRSHLYMWAVDRICPEKSRLSNNFGEILGNKADFLRAAGVPGKDAVMRLLFRTTAMLFKELCRELVD
jgi:hypothetical protein